MKKLLYLLPAVLCLATLAGCSDWGEDPGMNTLELESADVSFNALGGMGSIVVKSTGSSLVATTGDKWCAASVSGRTVDVLVTVNNALLARSTAITLVSGERKVVVPVTQSGVQIDIDRAVTLPAAVGSTVVKPVDASGTPLSVRVNSPAPSWIEAAISGSDLVVQATKSNETSTARTATLSLTAGPLTAQIKVTQEAR